MKKALNNEQLEPLIFTIRGQRVLLDADLARLYGLATYRFNEAFKRNKQRFPADFAFQLTAGEFEHLASQASDFMRHNSSQFAMSSSRHRGAAYRPWAFTEHGALMAEIDKTLLRHDAALRDVYQKLLPLLQPPPAPPKRRIGF